MSDELTKPYRGAVEAPYGTAVYEADSLTELFKLMRIDPPTPDTFQDTSDIHALSRAWARQMLVLPSGRCHPSSVIHKQVDVDVVRCYMQGMRIQDIVAWFKRHKQVAISKSAVGRYVHKLRDAGCLPLPLVSQ